MQTAKTDQTGRMPFCWFCHEALDETYEKQTLSNIQEKLVLLACHHVSACTILTGQVRDADPTLYIPCP